MLSSNQPQDKNLLSFKKSGTESGFGLFTILTLFPRDIYSFFMSGLADILKAFDRLYQCKTLLYYRFFPKEFI